MTHIKYFLLVLFFTQSMVFLAQTDVQFGVSGGFQINSAILPNVELNGNPTDIYNGDDVAKGVPQYADITWNYRLGVFTKYEDGFGFTQLNIDYTTTRVFKEYKYQTGLFGNYTTTAIDRKYSYADMGLSYNIYLSKNHTAYFGLGGGPGFLLSYTGDQEPTPVNWNANINLGFAVNENISIQTKAQLGLSEVYKDSYIHHIMIPVTLQVSF